MHDPEPSEGQPETLVNLHGPKSPGDGEGAVTSTRGRVRSPDTNDRRQGSSQKIQKRALHVS
jgi:hypothetical protein